MKLLNPALVIAACLTLPGCASLFPPTAQDMAKIPVVRFGENAPAAGEFVMLYPKGAALPVNASVAGSLLNEKVSVTLQPSVNRDIYQYRQWVSFDGKTWMDGRDALETAFRIDMPGVKDGRNPGGMSAVFNLK